MKTTTEIRYLFMTTLTNLGIEARKSNINKNASDILSDVSTTIWLTSNSDGTYEVHDSMPDVQPFTGIDVRFYGYWNNCDLKCINVTRAMIEEAAETVTNNVFDTLMYEVIDYFDEVEMKHSKPVNTKSLTIEQILDKAPAVGTMEKSPLRPARYSHLASKTLMEAMENNGYIVRNVMQKRHNDPTAAHIIRFTPGHVDMFQDHPEIVVYNSHNGKGALRIEPGFYRQVCTNGLVISTESLPSVRYRHMKTTIEDVINGASLVMESMGDLIGMVDSMKGYTMSQKEMEDFAKFAAQIRFNKLQDKNVDRNLVHDVIQNAYKLLTPFRDEDKRNDLWTVYNTLQENCIKGGQRLHRRQLISIKDPRRDLLVNRALSNAALNILNGRGLDIDSVLEAQSIVESEI